MIHTETVSKVLKKFDWDDQNFYDQKNKNMEIYDKAFHHTGIYANKIFQTVLEANQLDNTLIIFFTDHGTGIGERFGERNYGSFTFEETIRTFCLFVGFGIKTPQQAFEMSKISDGIVVGSALVEKIKETKIFNSFSWLIQTNEDA